MKQHFLLFALLVFCLSGKTQPTTIQFSDSLYCEENLSHTFVFLEHVNGNHVRGHFVGDLSFIYPENFKHSDTAFTHEYFIGYKGKIKRGIGILIGDYNSSSPTMYVDYNNNLNFRDDGDPIIFIDSTAYLTLPSKANPTAQFSLLYSLPKFDSTKTHFLNKTFNVDTQTTKGLMSSKYWYYSKRHNNKLSKTLLNGDSLKIVLHDYNCNGTFNDPGEDLVFVNQPMIPFDAFPTSGCITLDSNFTLFSFNDQIYRIVEIEPTGRFITFEETDLPYEKPLGPGDQMPNLMLPTPQGDSLSLKSMIDGKHYLVIDMWADWCKPCHASAPKLKEFAEKHRDKVKVLGVSPHNLNDAVANYTTKYGHDWTQALTTKEFMKTFLAEEYPRYILVDPTGKIISLKTYPHQIEALIE
ncbi:TlpA family protein disulfide reductase [Owenweeksia hongkongensis]|uniref:TlpA family protein disulfide reductase n=1 Tax=Owenweeksia hongkongensis TaxID=253245 RepID=UPI003A92EBF3